MSNDTPSDRSKRRFDASLIARNLEIELFWKRSLFFWGFVAATFVGYSTARQRSPHLATMLACFGLICSFVWTLANRGGKYWYENWEQKLEAVEPEVTGPLFKIQEPAEQKGWWLSARRYSVSKLAIALSDFVVLFWLALVVADCVRLLKEARALASPIAVGTLAFVGITGLFLVAVAFKGRSR